MQRRPGAGPRDDTPATAQRQRCLRVPAALQHPPPVALHVEVEGG